MGWNTLNQQTPSQNEKFAFVPSKYQHAFFDWLRTGSGNAVINAVAGSGKSKSLIEGSRILSELYAAEGKRLNILFCAFNKSIVQELQSKLPHNVACKTINAIGHGALTRHFGRLTLNDQKYSQIANNIIAEVLFVPREKVSEVRKTVKQIVSFAQSTLVDTDDDDALDLMCKKYTIEFPSDVPDATPAALFEVARMVLDAGITVAETMKEVSFNDQIWLPHVLNLDPYPVEWAFVDECQDLSRAKLELILRLRARRYVFVGDPRQSIYGFAGADPSSFQNIIERTQATVLPLSICYRCPKSHVALAQEIVPAIEAHESAIDGVIESIKLRDLRSHARENDLILCRFTAPLIRACIDFIKARIPARVKGRDIGDSLVSMAREALGNQPYALLPEALDAYVAKQREKLAKKEGNEGLIQAIEDRADGIMACYTSFATCHTIDQLAWEINAIFDDGKAAIELATIHRAKGLEAERVFLLMPDVLPFTWNGQAGWQYEQEENIEYVAYTRAKKTLIFVNEEGR